MLSKQTRCHVGPSQKGKAPMSRTKGIAAVETVLPPRLERMPVLCDTNNPFQ